MVEEDIRSDDVTVCLVDDDEIMRDLLSRNIRRTGCRVLLAESPEDAASLLAAEKVDLVLSDYRMPTEIEGLALLSHMSEHFPDMPVVMMSSELSSDTEDTLKSSGAFECLLKPFSSESLLSVIGRVVERA